MKVSKKYANDYRKIVVNMRINKYEQYILKKMVSADDSIKCRSDLIRKLIKQKARQEGIG